MHKPDWQHYRWRLLEAGLGWRYVARHVRELRDHFDDLQRQARNDGNDDVTASRQAAEQLGSLEVLADNLIAHGQPCLVRRHPVLMTVLLPCLVFMLSSALLVLSIIGAGWVLSDEIPELFKAHLETVATVLQALLALYNHLMVPLLLVVMITVAVRNHCGKRYWIAGALLLALAGSCSKVFLEVSDPPQPGKNAIGMAMDFALHESAAKPTSNGNKLRLLVNLLLAATAAGWCVRRERKNLQGNTV